MSVRARLGCWGAGPADQSKDWRPAPSRICPPRRRRGRFGPFGRPGAAAVPAAPTFPDANLCYQSAHDLRKRTNAGCGLASDASPLLDPDTGPGPAFVGRPPPAASESVTVGPGLLPVAREGRAAGAGQRPRASVAVAGRAILRAVSRYSRRQYPVLAQPRQTSVTLPGVGSRAVNRASRQQPTRMLAPHGPLVILTVSARQGTRRRAVRMRPVGLVGGGPGPGL